MSIPRFSELRITGSGASDPRPLVDVLASEYAPTDEGEIAIELHKLGYPDVWISALVASATERWRKNQCGTCGEQATHMWASLGENGVPSSMNGAWTFTPSCDECSGNSFDDGAGRPVIRAPLGTPTAIPQPEVRGIEQILNEFDAETLDNQQHLDEAMSRPLLNRVADHVAYTEKLQRRIVRAQRELRDDA